MDDKQWGKGRLLCLWLVELSGVFKIKRKTKQQNKILKKAKRRHQLFALILSEKLPTGERRQEMSFTCVKMQVPQDRPWKDSLDTCGKQPLAC